MLHLQQLGLVCGVMLGLVPDQLLMPRGIKLLSARLATSPNLTQVLSSIWSNPHFLMHAVGSTCSCIDCHAWCRGAGIDFRPVRAFKHMSHVAC